MIQICELWQSVIEAIVALYMLSFAILTVAETAVMNQCVMDGTYRLTGKQINWFITYSHNTSTIYHILLQPL